eukprot:CAMPEP_0178706060 /NCGR_PEP_ID=MMETSP0699-20121125/15177_1 /TAXON_ID=265572 /ORGANISM="Extubocellulus spinifer, Strain CCMP396" /LENGTH=461 /DNA_ID=CAMNT_0020353779 /DNA_START=18 /DNA_END=1403 /DNA_ORIENTATION=+
MPPQTMPFHHTPIEERFRTVAADRRRRAVSIFGLAFAPSFTSSGNSYSSSTSSRYLLGCSSTGRICFWDLTDGDSGRGRALAVLDVTAKQWGHHHSNHLDASVMPIYHISFIEKKPDQQQQHQQHTLLVVAVRGGVLLYRWSDIEAKLDRIAEGKDDACLTTTTKVQQSTCILGDVHPITTLPVHPNPNPRALGRIQCTSFDASNDILYGAADDGFGTYVWDIEREELLGTLGRRSGVTNSLHSVVCSIDGGGKVITGGDGGQIDVWDGRQLSLIESVDCSSCFRDGVAAAGTVLSDSGKVANLDKVSLSISSMDMTGSGDWAAIGGQCMRHPSTRRESSITGGGGGEGGFVSLFHLPSRTLSSAYVTCESIHDIKYVDSFQKIATVGNEGVVSYWNSSDLSTGRGCRAWISTPNAHCIAVDGAESSSAHGNGDSLFAVGGTGSMVDCFSNGSKVHSLDFA